MRFLPTLVFVFAVLFHPCFADDDPKKARVSFEKADKALNEVWASLKAKLDPFEFKSLQEQQRNWLAYRDYIATGIGTVGPEPDEEKAKKTPQYLESAAGLMESRVEFLRSYLKDPGPDDSLTGVWSDSEGGRIELVQRDGKLYFSLDVVRGPTFHTGGIAGIARWNEPLGFYSDDGKDGDDEKRDEETWIIFRKEGAVLKLDCAKTQHYHGARAYFDGSYRRVAAIDSTRATKVFESAKKRVSPNEKE